MAANENNTMPSHNIMKHPSEDRMKSDSVSKRPSRKDNSEVEECRNFRNNRCNRGADCKYRHPEPDSSSQMKDLDRSRSRSPMARGSSDADNGDICRDFLRNMCSRGKNCRYNHPPEGEVDRKPWFTLCLDFQNGRCTRHECRYFHITPEDEAIFRESGEIGPHIVDQAMRKALITDVGTDTSKPTCKDYLKGICMMRVCRYRHVNRREYEDEVYNALRDEFHRLVGSAKKPILPKKPLIGYGSRDDDSPLLPMSDYGRGRGMDRNMGYPSQEPYSPFGGRNSSQEYLGGRHSLTDPSGRSPPNVGPRRDFNTEPFQYQETRDNARDGFSPQGKVSQYSEGGGMFSNSGNDGRSYGAGAGVATSRVNSQLQFENQRLFRENERLVEDLKSSKNREREKQLKVDEVEMKNEDCLRQVETLKKDLQAWERYENFIKEQAYYLQSRLPLVERELSQSWGGGPPPLASQRELWDQLKGIVMRLLNTSAGKEQNPSSGYATSAPASATRNSAPNDFQERGAWKGNDTYRTYTAGNSSTVPVNLTGAPQPSGAGYQSVSRGSRGVGSDW